MKLFHQLNTEKMCELVSNAKKQVTFIGPALSQELAAAIVKKHQLLGEDGVTIVLDYNEEIFRLGYGDHGAIELLQENNVPIRKQAGLRISTLLVDNNGWVLQQSPRAVEDANAPFYNAIALQPEQVIELAQAIGIRCTIGVVSPADDSDKSSQHKPKPSASRPDIEIGCEHLLIAEVKTVKKALDDNPPQAFDLQRQVRVYSSKIEFVDIELEGGRISQRTIKLPPRIRKSIFGDDEEIEKRLTASYRLLDGTHNEGLNAINKQVDVLRQYTKTLSKRLGRVMLVSNKKAFMEKRDGILQSIEDWKKDAVSQLATELDQSITSLAEAGAKNLLDQRPPDFISTIEGPPSREHAIVYLKKQFEKAAPKAEDLVERFKLHCTFKSVTYEMLKEDKEFLESINETFPSLKETLFAESDAAYVRPSGLTVDLFSN